MYRIPMFMEGGGSAPAETPDMADVIQIDDLELERLRGQPDDEGSETGATPAAEETATDSSATPAKPATFVMFPGGIKVPLDASGALTDDAIQKALKGQYVPESVFHAELAKAKTPVARPSTRTVSEPEKPPAPFVRAENKHDKDDDPEAYWAHERAQDKLEQKHEFEAYKAESQKQLRYIQSTVSRQVIEREAQENEASFTREFNEAISAQKVTSADAPPRQAMQDLLWNVISCDPRHPLNPRPEGVDVDPVHTQDLLKEYWEVINNYTKHEIALELKRIGATGGRSIPSPHKGGSASMAAAAGGAEGRTTRPTQLPMKEGESAAQSVMRGLASGIRAPRG